MSRTPHDPSADAESGRSASDDDYWSDPNSTGLGSTPTGRRPVIAAQPVADAAEPALSDVGGQPVSGEVGGQPVSGQVGGQSASGGVGGQPVSGQVGPPMPTEQGSTGPSERWQPDAAYGYQQPGTPSGYGSGYGSQPGAPSGYQFQPGMSPGYAGQAPAGYPPHAGLGPQPPYGPPAGYAASYPGTGPRQRTPLVVTIGSAMTLVGGIVTLLLCMLMMVFAVALATFGIREMFVGMGAQGLSLLTTTVLSVAAILLTIWVLMGRAWAAVGLAIIAGCHLVFVLVRSINDIDGWTPVVAGYPVVAAALLLTPAARDWYRAKSGR